jgi:hypothetical protein
MSIFCFFWDVWWEGLRGELENFTEGCPLVIGNEIVQLA